MGAATGAGQVNSRVEVPDLDGVAGGAVEDASGRVEGDVADDGLAGRTRDLARDAVDADWSRAHLTSRSGDTTI